MLRHGYERCDNCGAALPGPLASELSAAREVACNACGASNRLVPPHQREAEMYELALCDKDGRELLKLRFPTEEAARQEAKRLLGVCPEAAYASLHYRGPLGIAPRHHIGVIHRDQ